MVNISLSKSDVRKPVEAKIYNIKGQLVRSLEVGNLSSDQYLYNWDCKDQRNNAVPAGIYLIRIKTERGEVSKKVTVLK
jgi:flagellar hook assembly protein FlgD